MPVSKALPIPPQAEADAASIEMVRVWIANRGLHCSLNVGVYSDNPGVDERIAWGIILADLTRHAASALRWQFSDCSESENIKTIVNSLLKELGVPSSRVEGGFFEGDA